MLILSNKFLSVPENTAIGYITSWEEKEEKTFGSVLEKETSRKRLKLRIRQMLGHFRTSMTRQNYAPYLTCPAAKSENNHSEASQEELRQAADILDNLLKF